jgi:hypothetical protein
MSENLEAFLQQAGQGCISGRVSEWPQLRPACAYAAAEITRLRQQLAVAREGLAKEAAVRAMAVEMGKEWANQLADMILERDTLRQQLAVAREGLVVIRGVGETGNPFTSLRECGQIARDTLAKLEDRP